MAQQRQKSLTLGSMKILILLKRRRECLVCGARFNTLESSELNYPRVTKSDESSEVFNETKIEEA